MGISGLLSQNMLDQSRPYSALIDMWVGMINVMLL